MNTSPKDTRVDARLIFVGGSPRSGTTLVQNMLDCHPEVLGGPEFLHLPDIIALGKKLHASIDREWIDLFCDHETVDRMLRRLCLDLLLPLADRMQAPRLSEKTPENVLVFPELARLFPNARFIHVVRDPRAIVASLLQVGERARRKGRKPAPFTADVDAAIRRVRRSLEKGAQAVREHPERVLTVRYEDVVENPERETRRICDFLGLQWTPAMCTPGHQPHLGEAAITEKSDELWYDRRSYYRNPDPSNQDKWRRQLTGFDHLAVIRAFRDDARVREFGYALDPTQIPMAVRLAYPIARFAGKILRRLR